MEASIKKCSKGNFSSSWFRFKRVIYAIYIRLLQQQLKGNYLIFIWLLLEPLMMIILFTALHTVMMSRVKYNYDIVIFLGSGFIPFFLFRTLYNTSLGIFKQHQSLFYLRQIKPIDIFLANIFFETSRYAIVTIVLLLIGWLIGIDIVPEDIDAFMVGVLWLTLFGASWGLLLGVLGFFYDGIQKFVRFLSLPLLILSAVFYTVSSVPPNIREYLLYNPLVHFMELIHASYIRSLDYRYVDFLYMVEWTIIPLFLGLWLYKKSEKRFISK